MPCGQERDRWGIVLEGGKGTRLRPLARRIAGDERPKQFCRVHGGRALASLARLGTTPAGAEAAAETLA